MHAWIHSLAICKLMTSTINTSSSQLTPTTTTLHEAWVGVHRRFLSDDVNFVGKTLTNPKFTNYTYMVKGLPIQYTFCIETSWYHHIHIVAKYRMQLCNCLIAQLRAWSNTKILIHTTEFRELLNHPSRKCTRVHGKMNILNNNHNLWFVCVGVHLILQ